MAAFTPLRELPPKSSLFRRGDVFVLFGELFGRGYANGLIEKAKAAGMTLIGATAGRREADYSLRALNPDELKTAEENLGGTVVNIPLEAGFDMDAPEGGECPVEMLKEVRRNDWATAELDWDKIEAAKRAGLSRFQSSLEEFVAKLDAEIPEGANVFIAHTMAGGIPRAKILMPIANGVFKGRGKRFVSSEIYWRSDIGKLCSANFDEVTSNTLKLLLEATAGIREKVASKGGEVRYTAYGYHGTEAMFGGKHQWQTYTPYKQGYAKMKMESVASEAWERGIKTTVFNCPEIRTNSSEIFSGGDLSLYPFMNALKAQGGEYGAGKLKECAAKIVDENIDAFLSEVESYFANPTIQKYRNFDEWPMENSEELGEVMIGTAEKLTDMHKDKKDLISSYLSGLVLESTGEIIFNEVGNPSGPVLWLGHEIILRQLLYSNQ